MLMQRSVAQNTMQWQTPSLAPAAQAFLLTIALGSSAAVLSRVLASSLGIVLAAMAMQLMAKHRYYSALDVAEMRRLERKLQLPPIADRKRQGDSYPGVRALWISRRRSYYFWQVGFSAFVLVNAVVLVIAIGRPALLTSRP
jgi:hypothetical protein